MPDIALLVVAVSDAIEPEVQPAVMRKLSARAFVTTREPSGA